MTTFILAPFACSAAVLACSLLGLRPLVMACALPIVLGGAWCIA